jgi:Cu/Ag efflux pump CusA
VQRRIIIQSNVAGGDLGSVINDVRAAISQKVALPQGYFVQYGGQFEAQEKASRQITALSLVALTGIFLLLYVALRSTRAALLVMANRANRAWPRELDCVGYGAKLHSRSS